MKIFKYKKEIDWKLDNEDGMVTQPDSETGHFDLYEYINCDLNKTFEFLKLLV